MLTVNNPNISAFIFQCKGSIVATLETKTHQQPDPLLAKKYFFLGKIARNSTKICVAFFVFYWNFWCRHFVNYQSFKAWYYPSNLSNCVGTLLTWSTIQQAVTEMDHQKTDLQTKSREEMRTFCEKTDKAWIQNSVSTAVILQVKAKQNNQSKSATHFRNLH